MKTALSPLLFTLITLGSISCVNEMEVSSGTAERDGPADISKKRRQEYLHTVFGERFVVEGDVMNRLIKSAVVHGRYDQGFPVGDWNFILSDAARLNIRWNRFHNNKTGSGFSIPFAVDETQVDEHFYRLTAECKHLGDVSIIVGVSPGILPGRQPGDLAHNVGLGLSEQGYRYKKTIDTLRQPGREYILSQYHLSDSSLQSGMLYNVNGLSCSGKNFVEISFFHSGANDDLARLIFSMITMNFYVRGDRFYNPYIQPLSEKEQ